MCVHATKALFPWDELEVSPTLGVIRETLDTIPDAPLLDALRGGVKSVVTGLRRLGTLRGLSGAKKKTLRTLTNYLSNNTGRMRYDEYLRNGYPIASGVIEGACRHYVKDRTERSGMRWTKAGAQAMLDVRSEFINGEWDQFQKHRIETETKRMHPHQLVLKDIGWPLVA